MLLSNRCKLFDDVTLHFGDGHLQHDLITAANADVVAHLVLAGQSVPCRSLLCLTLFAAKRSATRHRETSARISIPETSA